MVAKCLVHMHITAKFKACWVTSFTYIFSDVESMCRPQYWCSGACNVAGYLLRGI